MRLTLRQNRWEKERADFFPPFCKRRCRRCFDFNGFHCLEKVYSRKSGLTIKLMFSRTIVPRQLPFANPIGERMFLPARQWRKRILRQCWFRARVSFGNSVHATPYALPCHIVQGRAQALQVRSAHAFVFQLCFVSLAVQVNPTTPQAKPQILRTGTASVVLP